MLNYEKSLSFEKYFIQNTPVFFPHSLYPSQEKLIDSILQALKTNSNGLFHSPTGTGKTLCFLVSILAYIESLEEKDVTFIYCTRTHSQMNSIVKELRKTCYEPQMTLLCSRDIFCINKDLDELNSDLKSIRCAEIKNECIYYQRLTEALKKDDKTLEQPIMDIEDLSEFAKHKEICPFYLCQELKKKAKLVISTYNYILDPRIRKKSQTYLKNAVVLFDEAHNIEEICEKYLTFSLKLNFFEKAEKIIQFIYDTSKDIRYVKRLEDVFQEIKSFTEKISKILKDQTYVQFAGEEILQIIDGVFQDSLLILNDEEPLKCLNEDKKKTLIFFKFRSILWKISYLQKKFYYKADEIDHFFWTLERKLGKNAFHTKISQFLFNPSIIFKSLLKERPKCIFLTSGTLAPFREYESRLGIRFNITLENSHTINSKENVVASILYKGISNKILFDFSKNSRENENKSEMLIDLGESLLRLMKIIPNGKLVFFTSYGYMQEVLSFWSKVEGNHIYKRFEEISKVFKETKLKHGEKQSKFLQKKQKNFYEMFFEEANKDQGAILFGVLRGKGSEGIDFSDKSARAVFIVGIPFGPYKEPQIKLKMEYLDKIQQKSAENKISGRDWYHLQAIKCINQGIGRVIRHRQDYGVLGLIDNRYERNLSIANISLWAREVLQRNDFIDFEKKVKKFFDEKEKTNQNLMKLNEENQQRIHKIDSSSKSELQENGNKSGKINEDLFDFLLDKIENTNNEKKNQTSSIKK